MRPANARLATQHALEGVGHDPEPLRPGLGLPLVISAFAGRSIARVSIATFVAPAAPIPAAIGATLGARAARTSRLRPLIRTAHAQPDPPLVVDPDDLRLDVRADGEGLGEIGSPIEAGFMRTWTS